MKEIWKDIKNYEGKYQISDLGRIKSLNFNNTNTSCILIPKIKKTNGIAEITLNQNNIHHYFTISRLVIETFTNLKLNRNHIIMYKDGNKQNCALNNLYIITRGKRQELTYDLDKRFQKKYLYYDKFLSIKHIAKINNYKINPKTIRSRLRQYWNIYESAEIPLAIYKKKGSI